MRFNFYLFLIVRQSDTQYRNPGSVTEKERRIDGELATTLSPQNGHMLRQRDVRGHFIPAFVYGDAE